MAITSLDTHDYVKRLTASGITYRQAEAHTKALTAFMGNELVRRSDLSAFKSEIKSDLSDFRSDLSAFKSEMKSELHTRCGESDKKFCGIETRFAGIQGQLDLLKWMTGFNLAGVLAIMLKLFL
ncbi:MAG TPA: coiled-coil domain-containing protein [Herbaspirillum sp.]|jgi:hypothetical protein|nr:coiled-coil domain-containing protein [Herbaspirillum sp.]